MVMIILISSRTPKMRADSCRAMTAAYFLKTLPITSYLINNNHFICGWTWNISRLKENDIEKQDLIFNTSLGGWVIWWLILPSCGKSMNCIFFGFKRVCALSFSHLTIIFNYISFFFTFYDRFIREFILRYFYLFMNLSKGILSIK